MIAGSTTYNPDIDQAINQCRRGGHQSSTGIDICQTRRQARTTLRERRGRS
jgi:hypothetical protein